MELGHVGPGDIRDSQAAEGREDKALQVAAVFLGRAGLHPKRDVFPVEAFRQFLDRDSLAPSIPLGGWILTILGCCDDCDGAGASLLAGEDGAGSKAHPARSASGTVLDDVALTAAGQDTEAEPRNVVVPDEIFGRPDIGGVYNAFGKFRHGRQLSK